MKKKEISKPSSKIENKESDDVEGYPLYPPSEDIYSKFEEVKDIDPDDPFDKKIPISIPEPDDDEVKELGEEEVMGTDLDVPGADLDDEQEEIGNEDEENNYWSIGGDNHADLEEDNGD